MDFLFGLDHVSAHDKELELLVTAYDPAHLMIVESILQGEEIPYLKKERGSGTTVRIITGFTTFGTDVFVLREHLSVAQELIAPPEETDGEEELPSEEN